jgi:hypothetical protein
MNLRELLVLLSWRTLGRFTIFVKCDITGSCRLTRHC